MSWFTSALQSACQKDLSDLNTNAVNTLQALQAYSLMFDTGCVVDPTTNSYCYVSAAVNSNPSDLYFYQLPLGTNLANMTTISCSACTKTLMSLYDSALTGSAASTLTGLQKTYGNSAALADAQCGDGYARQLNAGRAMGLHMGMAGVLGATVVVLAGWSI
jgi:outer membrane receptor for monomeric catechols